MSQPVTGRTASSVRPGVDVARIEAMLRRRESSLTMQLVLMIALGIPLSFVAPLMVTVFLFLRDTQRMEPFHFWPTFGIASAIAIPVTYLLAWLVRGSVIDRTIDPMEETSRAGYEVRGRVVVVLAMLDLANVGPRIVLSSIRRLNARRALKNVDVPRAAKAVAMLASSGQGIAPEKLLLPGESAETLESLVAFLMFHDLADTSKDGNRIWLQSSFRSKLSV